MTRTPDRRSREAPEPRVAAARDPLRAAAAGAPQPHRLSRTRLGRADAEREADCFADAVAADRPSTGRCHCGGLVGPDGTCTACRARARATASREPTASPLIPRGGGHELEPEMRGRLERRAGRDLSDVRVHDGSDAAGLAASLHAHAYAIGPHVVLGTSDPLRGPVRLLAHEVAHTIQQREGGAQGPQFAAPAPATPSWLTGVKATHVTGNIWEVEMASAGPHLVGPYTELVAYAKSIGMKVDVHHIVGGEHLSDIHSSFTYDNAPAVALDPGLHEKVITPRIGYEQAQRGGRRGGRPILTVGEVVQIYRAAYTEQAAFGELATLARNIAQQSAAAPPAPPPSTTPPSPPASKPAPPEPASQAVPESTKQPAVAPAPKPVEPAAAVPPQVEQTVKTPSAAALTEPAAKAQQVTPAVAAPTVEPTTTPKTVGGPKAVEPGGLRATVGVPDMAVPMGPTLPTGSRAVRVAGAVMGAGGGAIAQWLGELQINMLQDAQLKRAAEAVAHLAPEIEQARASGKWVVVVTTFDYRINIFEHVFREAEDIKNFHRAYLLIGDTYEEAMYGTREEREAKGPVLRAARPQWPPYPAPLRTDRVYAHAMWATYAPEPGTEKNRPAVPRLPPIRAVSGTWTTGTGDQEQEMLIIASRDSVSLRGRFGVESVRWDPRVPVIHATLIDPRDPALVRESRFEAIAPGLMVEQTLVFRRGEERASAAIDMRVWFNSLQALEAPVGGGLAH